MTKTSRDLCLRLWPLLLAGMLWAPLGCTAPGAKPAGSTPAAPVSAGSRIDEINLVTMPVPINLESLPGIDGIVLKIYAVNYQHPRTQAIAAGALEVLMYDGLVRGGPGETNQCRHQWSFSAEELRGYAFTTRIGTGYSFRLGWGKDRPQQDKISVVARYQPPQGQPIYSSPSYIPIPGTVPAPAAAKPAAPASQH